MIYLITGATGYIARHFIASLTDMDQVFALTRRPVYLGPKCQIIESLDSIPDDTHIDCILNLAGEPIDSYWSESKKEKLLSSRLNTTEQVIQLITRLKTKPACFISASAIGFYGGESHEVLHENSQPIDSFTHQLCQKWEACAKRAEQFNVRVCIARLGVVLGKNSGFISRTYWPFFMGLGGNIGSGEQIFSWIHIQDVIEAFHFMQQTPTCQGPFNLVAPHSIANRDLTQAMAKLLNRPAFFHLPSWLIRSIFGQMGDELLLKGNHVYPQKLLDMKFHFHHPRIESALSDCYR